MKSRRDFIRTSSLLLTSAGIFGYQVSHSSTPIKVSDSKSVTSMIQHNVYFYYKSEVTEDQKKAFLKGVKDFVAKVKEVQKIEIGVPAGTPERPVIDKEYGCGLFTWFKTIEDHNVYQEHPAHKKFIEDYAELWSEVKVFDTQLI